MARSFVYDLQTVAGLVQAFSTDTLQADDLPRVLPSPAGGYALMTASVDQWGRVATASSGSSADVIAALGYTPEPAFVFLSLAKGGTASDLSATGPGLVFQGSAGAALAVSLDLNSVGDLVFGKITSDRIYAAYLNAVADTLIVFDTGFIGTNQVAAAAGPVGNVVGKLPIYDTSLNLLGYIPVYDDIT